MDTQEQVRELYARAKELRVSHYFLAHHLGPSANSVRNVIYRKHRDVTEATQKGIERVKRLLDAVEKAVGEVKE